MRVEGGDGEEALTPGRVAQRGGMTLARFPELRRRRYRNEQR